MQKGGLPNVVIFCWKFLLATLVQFCFVLWGRGGPPTLRCLCGCWKWVAVSAICTTGAALNTISNLETTSVSALLFFYVAPLWALVFGVLLLREVMQRRTVIAVTVALLGVVLLFVPSVLNARAQQPDAGHGTVDATQHAASFHGDVLGLLSGLAMAGYLTACRHASLFKPDAPMVLGVAIGSLGAALIGVYLAFAGGHSLLAVPSDMWAPLVADCLGIAMYGVMSALATAYLPGAEVAFLLLIDVIVAPLLVCVVHGEVPTAAGTSGAALLAAAVIGHEVAALRDARRLPQPPLVGGSSPRSRKLRVSDGHLLPGLVHQHGSDDEAMVGVEMSSLSGAETEAENEHDESTQLLATPAGPATHERRVSWASPA